MAQKDIIFIIVAEQAYIHSADSSRDFSYGNEQLFTAISGTYIPLLNLFCTLEAEHVPFKLGMVMGAPLCTLLADAQVQKQYVSWLDKRIALGKLELERAKDDPDMLDNVRSCLRKLQKDKLDFTETYGQNLLKKFRHFADKGYLEFIPTAATYAYLPHYADIKEVLNAQVETGLYAHRTFFGETGEGFFLPYMGWADGFEKLLRSYGINYTVLDTRALLFSGSPCSTGIFTPVRTNNSLVLFGRDSTVPDVISGPDGFMHRAVYRNQQRDAGYDLPDGALEDFLGTNKTRLQTQFKYWNNGGSTYSQQDAQAQAVADALSFFSTQKEKLVQAAAGLDDSDAVLVCTIPAALLGSSWHEGILWLEQVIRAAAAQQDVALGLCRDNLQKQFTLQKIAPYPCSAEGTGYAENLLDSSNNWMMRYVRKASERMTDLTERFPSESGIKARMLNLGAREVLLAQSGDWAKMIHDGQLPEYAEQTFKKNILNFTAVFDSLASNTVSTEWLCNMEKEDCIFPWMNYRVFSRKK